MVASRSLPGTPFRAFLSLQAGERAVCRPRDMLNTSPSLHLSGSWGMTLQTKFGEGTSYSLPVNSSLPVARLKRKTEMWSESYAPLALST